MAAGNVVLHTFCHSSCGWRVRLALDIKGIPYRYNGINFSNGDHLTEEFLKISPLQLVPVLEIDGVALCDSIAILEYLEERFPDKKALLPSDLKQRAAVRHIVNTIASNIQPLQNLRVLIAIQDLAGPDERLKWAQNWIKRGFTALERILEKSAGKYCIGDKITWADITLAPQMRNAKRYGVDETLFPTLHRVHKNLYELEVVKNSIPENQPDFKPV